jgi:hypothetical protein
MEDRYIGGAIWDACGQHSLFGKGLRCPAVELVLYPKSSGSPRRIFSVLGRESLTALLTGVEGEAWALRDFEQVLALPW